MVPPTMKLPNRAFGEAQAPIVFGWIMVGHQLGATTAAFGAGLIRAQTGSYLPAFIGVGLFAIIAAIAILSDPLVKGSKQTPAFSR